MQIWKYPIEDFDFRVEMPEGAEIIHVSMQHGFRTAWAAVDPNQPMKVRRLVTVGTGHNFNRPGLEYLGTVQNRDLVWHIFEGPT